MSPSDILRSQVGTITTFDDVLNAVANAFDTTNQPEPVEPESELSNPDHPRSHHRR